MKTSITLVAAALLLAAPSAAFAAKAKHKMHHPVAKPAVTVAETSGNMVGGFFHDLSAPFRSMGGSMAPASAAPAKKVVHHRRHRAMKAKKPGKSMKPTTGSKADTKAKPKKGAAQ